MSKRTPYPKLSSAARGYGAEHRRIRRQVALLVESGAAVCWRCGLPIGAREPWDLGHDDHDRTRYRGPEHTRCNRATKTRGIGDPGHRRAGWA